MIYVVVCVLCVCYLLLAACQRCTFTVRRWHIDSWAFICFWCHH